MARMYLPYTIVLEEPLILSDGSQTGNVLRTQDYIPGSTILGACAGLFVKAGHNIYSNGSYSKDFRALFLSDRTIYSPAYSLAEGAKRTFPMPCSAFGCKYYGTREPRGISSEMHGFDDYLYASVPDECNHADCGAPLEHKGGYCFYESPRWDYCNFQARKRVISHNEVSEKEEDRHLFAFECLTEGQQFYGEIAFSDQSQAEIICDLIKKHPVVKLGKARSRGYGKVRFLDPVSTPRSLREEFASAADSGEVFSVYLYSDTILVDRHLNYCRTLDGDNLARFMGLDDPEAITVYDQAGSDYKSFYKEGLVFGFNRKRRMPLPMEKTISRGSVFTVSYNGVHNIGAGLKKLMREGLGERRNEGFGMVVINHRIHGDIG